MRRASITCMVLASACSSPAPESGSTAMDAGPGGAAPPDASAPPSPDDASPRGGDLATGSTAAPDLLPAPAPIVDAAPFHGSFTPVAGLATFSLPMPDGVNDPSVTRGFFLGQDRLAILSEGTVGVPARTDFYAFRGAALSPIGSMARSFAFAADVDGDGLAELFGSEVVWGDAPDLTMIGTPLPEGLGTTGMAADVDGDGQIDLLGRRSCGEGVGPPAHYLRRTGPRTFASETWSLPSLMPALNVQSYAQVALSGRTLLLALGWSCNSPTDSLPLATAYENGAYQSVTLGPRPGGYSPQSPMAALGFDGRCLLLSTNPEAIELCDAQEVPVPFQYEPSPLGAPMLPWSFARVTLEGRDVFLIAHGIDSYYSPQHKMIGMKRSRVTAWEKTNAGWARVSGIGLDAEGEWRWLAADTLGGAPAIVVGGFGQDPVVYRFQ